MSINMNQYESLLQHKDLDLTGLSILNEEKHVKICKKLVVNYSAFWTTKVKT